MKSLFTGIFILLSLSSFSMTSNSSSNVTTITGTSFIEFPIVINRPPINDDGPGGGGSR